jgi:hypothetical protein
MTEKSSEFQAMSSACPTRHPEYYFDDGSLVMLVGISIKQRCAEFTNASIGRIYVVQCPPVNIYKTLTSIFGCIFSAQTCARTMR